MVFCFFLGQVVNGARLPVENCDVDGGSRFRLIVDCEAGTIGRPDGSGFGNIGSESEVGDFAAVAGNRVEVIDFAAALVRFEDDPFAVGRPYRVGLSIVGLTELNWPTTGGIDLPEIVAAGDVGREGDLVAVGRPGGAEDSSREEEVIDGDGAGASSVCEVRAFGLVISRVSGESEAKAAKAININRLIARRLTFIDDPRKLLRREFAARGSA